MEDGESVTETMTYNSYCAMTSYTDPNGNTTRYAYDNDGRLIKELYDDGTEKKCIRDGEGNITKVIYPSCNGGSVVENAVYDATGNLIKVINALGGISDMSYSAYKTVKSISALDEEIRYTYDSYGRVKKQKSSNGADISYTYDAAGRIVTVKDADGNESKLSYNDYGDLTSLIDAEGNVTKLAYDSYGNITSMTDANNHKNTLSYDSYGNCIKSVDALGLVTTYVYDKYGNVIKEIKNSGNDVRKTEYDYDVMGRVVSVTDALDNTISVDYDAFGNVTDIYDTEGTCIKHTEYDNRNRAVSDTDANGAVTGYSYDDYGNVVSETADIGKDVKTGKISKVSTLYSYVGGDYLSSVKDVLGGVSKYSYDDAGNITSITNPNGGVTDFSYDERGNLTSEKVSGGSSIKYTYNAKDLLEEKINSKNQKTKYEYDKTGRLVKLTDEEGVITYTYDGVGNVLKVTETRKDGSVKTIKRTYDAAGRVTSYTDGNSNTIRYEYNGFGELAKLTYPDGKIVTYDYDKNGNLIKVTDYKNRVTTYEYNSNGCLVREVRPDNSVEEYEYDAAGQMISKLDKTSLGDVISSYKYTYNLAGNITAIDKEVAESGRAISSSTGVSGNASRKSTVTMEYSSDNRLIRYNDEEIRYDADGNMTYGPLNGEMVEFTYDCRNRLVKAGDTEYTYDAENNRIGKKTGSEETKYVINPNTRYSQVLVAIKLGNSFADKEYIFYTYGRGLISEEHSNLTSSTGSGKTEYLIHHYDQVGSTVALTDGSGNIVDIYEYSTYGKLLSGDSTLTEFLYNGSYGVMTDSNGLYYMRARYYNPTILRFINQDVVLGVLTATQSLNRYAYCEGNPISFLDPFGLSRFDTSGLHSFLGVANLIATIISFCGFPEIGFVVSVGISILDIGLLIYDIRIDLEEHKSFDSFFEKICKIAFDIVSIIPGAKTLKYGKELNVYETTVTKSYNKIGIEIEQQCRKYYDRWNTVGIGVSLYTVYQVLKDIIPKFIDYMK